LISYSIFKELISTKQRSSNSAFSTTLLIVLWQK